VLADVTAQPHQAVREDAALQIVIKFWRAEISPSLSNAPFPSPSPRRTPLSTTLPYPAVRVQAALHCTPPCYGPLPRDCRGALGGARPGWRRQKGFIFPIRHCGHPIPTLLMLVCTLHAHDLCQCSYNTSLASLQESREGLWWNHSTRAKGVLLHAGGCYAHRASECGLEPSAFRSYG
jgi:hypothetical protein